jgi:putative ABC transport system permease protein
VDKDQPVGRIRALEDIVADSIGRQRFAALLLGVFSAVALILATVGIYGVTAYNVTRRTGEFGIRLALGAQPRDVVSLVFRQGGKLIGLGLLLGLGAALIGARLIASMLYDTSTHDPLTLAAITLTLGAVAAFASWLPARRATKVDPIVALRAE